MGPVSIIDREDRLFGGIPTAFYFKGVSGEPLYHFNSFVTFFGGLSLSSVNTSGGITFFGHLYRNWTGNYENTITGAKIASPEGLLYFLDLASPPSTPHYRYIYEKYRRSTSRRPSSRQYILVDIWTEEKFLIAQKNEWKLFKGLALSEWKMPIWLVHIKIIIYNKLFCPNTL